MFGIPEYPALRKIIYPWKIIRMINLVNVYITLSFDFFIVVIIKVLLMLLSDMTLSFDFFIIVIIKTLLILLSDMTRDEGKR